MSTVSDKKNKKLKNGKRIIMGEREYQLMLLKPNVAKRALYAFLIFAVVVVSISIFFVK